MAFRKKICVDFDGVVHWYRDGWKEGVIYDEPVPGAFSWLAELVGDPDFEVCIYSSRSKEPGGVATMAAWFLEHDLPQAVFDELEFPTQKPAAYLTIDDRAICFEGTFPTRDEMSAFKPWMKR